MALEGKPRKSLAEELAPDYLLQDREARSKAKDDKILHRAQGRMKEKQRIVKSLGCCGFPAKEG